MSWEAPTWLHVAMKVHYSLTAQCSELESTIGCLDDFTQQDRAPSITLENRGIDIDSGNHAEVP